VFQVSITLFVLPILVIHPAQAYHASIFSAIAVYPK
jgi:hypothetical protein